MLSPNSPLRHHAFTSAAVMLLASGCVPGTPAAPDRAGGSPDASPGANADAGSLDASAPKADAGQVADSGAPDSGAACTPACSNRTCGDDSCGGSCGTCEANAQCSADGQCEISLCPPTGPTGTSVGQVFPNLALQDCDGNSYMLHELCAAKASHVFIMAGW